MFTLSTADRPYRMFVESMREGAATVSAGGTVLYANRRLAGLLSRPRESIVGSALSSFVAGGVDVALQLIRSVSEPGATIELDIVDVDGVSIPVLVGIAPLNVDGDDLTCLTFTDLSDQKAQAQEISRLGFAQAERLTQLQKAQAALTEQATQDALTSLPNRVLLLDRISRALTEARRTGLNVAILFIDLDRFKQVNDSHGHSVGDTVLRSVALQLSRAIRAGDTVARIGGDEFVVLAHEVDSSRQAVEIAKRLIEDLRQRSGAAADGGQVAASIGISFSIAGRGNPEALLEEADAAMYHAKSMGGARAEVFGVALGHQVHLRSAGRQLLRSALDQDRVIVHYQPIVDLTTARVAGFEALARIAEPDGSIVPPSAFIPAAEDSGLVVPLDQRVLHLACRQSSSWRPSTATDPPLTVAVNLSGRQFERGNLPSLVHATLEQAHLPPQRLHLELTETAIMDLRPDVMKQLGQIKELGVQIGLDDFGTGYASLTHLRRLPLTFVKIDQSFVQGLQRNPEDAGIVTAVIALAANLGLRSIAEGVETTGQLDRLRELGCDQAQGHLFARPMPPADVPAAIQRPPW